MFAKGVQWLAMVLDSGAARGNGERERGKEGVQLTISEHCIDIHRVYHLEPFHRLKVLCLLGKFPHSLELVYVWCGNMHIMMGVYPQA